jgi:hypothetical protein
MEVLVSLKQILAPRQILFGIFGEKKKRSPQLMQEFFHVAQVLCEKSCIYSDVDAFAMNAINCLLEEKNQQAAMYMPFLRHFLYHTPQEFSVWFTICKRTLFALQRNVRYRAWPALCESKNPVEGICDNVTREFLCEALKRLEREKPTNEEEKQLFLDHLGKIFVGIYAASEFYDSHTPSVDTSFFIRFLAIVDSIAKDAGEKTKLRADFVNQLNQLKDDFPPMQFHELFWGSCGNFHAIV